MNARIFCLGNELVRDDGLGIRVGRILQELPLPAGVEVELVPHLGLDLLDGLAGTGTVILVDAMSTGQAPGTCLTLDGPALQAYGGGASGSHTLGIGLLMELARRLAPAATMPALYLVGVEGACFDEYGLELTPDVEAAVPRAVAAVLALLGADEDLLAAGRAAAVRPLPSSAESSSDANRSG